ncbi:hypothetical protein ACFQJ7_08010 [Halovenus rubra]|uniref:Uncharacterized protein n=2 Tax=Halovenus rubra TaxID=869890 RepID=A0ABD5X667_9EURY|nr:hypothetical protein [Halovenus rubra]
MSAIALKECDDCGDVVKQYPRFATAVAIILGTVTYAAISLVMDGSIATLESGLFGVLFGVSYTGARVITGW